MAIVVKDKSKVEWDIPATRRKFPWDDWTNGEIWKTVEGIDFAANAAVFKTQLKNRAEKLGAEVKIKTEKSEKGPVSVLFQFVS